MQAALMYEATVRTHLQLGECKISSVGPWLTPHTYI